MAKKRPVGVIILTTLAVLSALVAIIHTLQMLHLFPIRGPLGTFHFFTFDPVPPKATARLRFTRGKPGERLGNVLDNRDSR